MLSQPLQHQAAPLTWFLQSLSVAQQVVLQGLLAACQLLVLVQ
jgi:hypothetical protein